jgi:hypothetical protein
MIKSSHGLKTQARNALHLFLRYVAPNQEEPPQLGLLAQDPRSTETRVSAALRECVACDPKQRNKNSPKIAKNFVEYNNMLV